MEETKKLTIPEGYEFDKVENGEVILKKEVYLPREWEECLCNGYFHREHLDTLDDSNAVPAELVKPMLALANCLSAVTPGGSCLGGSRIGRINVINSVSLLEKAE